MVWGDKDEQFAGIVDTEWLTYDDIRFAELYTVHDYWDRVKGDKFAPTLTEFRLDDLPPAIIPNMVVIDFIGPPLDFHYRFFGTKMVETSGIELTGKTYFADKVEGYGFVNAEIFPMVIEQRRPIYTRTKWVSVKALTKFTTTIRLPLSADGERVTHGVTANHFETAACAPAQARPLM